MVTYVSDDGDVEIAASPYSPEDASDKDAGTGTSPAEDEAPSTTPKESCAKTWLRKVINFYKEYDVLVLLVFVILLAYAYPPLGADYLEPQITATWIAVMYIFCKSMVVRVLRSVPLASVRFKPLTSTGGRGRGRRIRALFDRSKA
jgi:hypothetical protein